jgi:hypothetical protein
MPRRGGRRAGTPGTAYGARTDLNQQRTLPVQTAPAQQYGQGAAQTIAQQAVPMATAPVPAVSAQMSPPAPVTPTPPAGAGGGAPAPRGPFDRPTERPGEPVTAGLPVGPGPGPEALGMAPPITAGAGNLAAVLGQLASASGDSNLAMLAQRARNLGQ